RAMAIVQHRRPAVDWVTPTELSASTCALIGNHASRSCEPREKPGALLDEREEGRGIPSRHLNGDSLLTRCILKSCPIRREPPNGPASSRRPRGALPSR